MSDIKDRLKFNSGTDKVTSSVADAVSEVLNSGQAPQSRMEKQAALHNYPLQEKPEVAEAFTKELQELKKAVADDKKAFVATARQAKKDGKKPSCLLVKSILVQSVKWLIWVIKKERKNLKKI